MLELRRALAPAAALNPRDFFSPYIFYEGEAQTLDTTLQSMGIILVAVFVFCCVMLNSIGAAFIVALSIAFSYVFLFAWLWLTGISLDTISMINLQIAAGFLVDGTAHIGHSFMLARGTRNERVTEALESMGSNVAYACLTTLVGIVLLVASQSSIFFIFFVTFVGIIVASALISLVFLPVALSLIGPASTADAIDLKGVEKERPEKATLPEKMELNGIEL